MGRVPGDSTSEHTNKHSLQLENVLTDFFKKNIHPKKYFSQLLPWFLCGDYRTKHNSSLFNSIIIGQAAWKTNPTLFFKKPSNSKI